MGYTPTASTEEQKIPPSHIYRIWHENYPNARR
jgi:hypothetical protein